MSLYGIWVFAAGFAGAFMAEMYSIIELRHKKPRDLPEYIHTRFYWFMVLLLSGIGGGLAVAYGTDEVNAVLAVNIGASAPLIVRSLASSVPAIGRARID